MEKNYKKRTCALELTPWILCLGIFRTTLILLSFHLCVSFTITAQVAFTTMTNILEFKKILKRTSDSTKSIECDFVQEKNMSMLTKKIISKGHFWFKKPNGIRWEYTEPYSYLIILLKKKVFVKDDNSKKQYDTQSSAMFKELGKMMFCFIQGFVACEKDYIISYMQNEKNYYIKLIPKSNSVQKMLSQIDLYFDKKDLTISKINMTETGGDYTLIEFMNKKINKKISDTIFSVK